MSIWSLFTPDMADFLFFHFFIYNRHSSREIPHCACITCDHFHVLMNILISFIITYNVHRASFIFSTLYLYSYRHTCHLHITLFYLYRTIVLVHWFTSCHYISRIAAIWHRFVHIKAWCGSGNRSNYMYHLLLIDVCSSYIFTNFS